MIAISKRPRQQVSNKHDEAFLQLLPDIERYACFALRSLSPQQREEGIHEVVGYAFCAYRRLVDLGKHELAYAAPLARFGVARFRAGRRVGTHLNSGDVFAAANPCSLNAATFGSNWVDMLADNTLTPVPDQVAFRLDFRAWLRLLNQRDRKLAEFMALGNSSKEAAQRFGVSRGRVSQVRGELYGSWRAFQGDVV